MSTPSTGQDRSDGWAPTEDVTIVVPHAGAGSEFHARTLASVLNGEELIPTAATVEIIEGLGDVAAANYVWHREPDGHTLLIINTEVMSLAQVLRAGIVDYDLTEMAALPRASDQLRALVVSTATDIRSFTDLNEATQAGEVTWGEQSGAPTSTLNAKAMAGLGGDDVFSLEDYEAHSVTFDSREEEIEALQRGDIHVMSGSHDSQLVIQSYLESQETGGTRFVFVYNQDDRAPSSIANPDCETFATAEVDIDNGDEIISIVGGPYHRLFVAPPETPAGIREFWCNTISAAIQSERYRQATEEGRRKVNYGGCDLAQRGIKETVDVYRRNKEFLQDLRIYAETD